MKNKRECPFACPANTYDGHAVRDNAVTNVENPTRYIPEAWNSGGCWVDDNTWVPDHAPAGCMLKVFNDGAQLPIEHIKRSVDITCVGPDSPACPAKQGYHFEKEMRAGGIRDIARK